MAGRSALAWRLAVPAVLAAVGLLLAASATTADGTDLRAERRSELADLIRAEQDRIEQADARAAALRDDVDALTADLATDPVARRLTRQIEPLAVASGLTPVVGPALSVRLDDAPVPVGGIPEGLGPDDYVVHQADVQAVVNALWAGGAEALQIMDQRIISTSAVRCVGSTLILQGRVYPPPYTVTAIGPQDRMREALDASPGVQLYRQWVDVVGLGWRVTGQPLVQLPGYAGGTDLSYAEPVTAP